ncbi:MULTISPECIES: ABC-2 family transporter protein [Spirulina sp. CCY15215]|uniref:ABC transporter permease n=1 Tax=Spirulina sp. CCY15215 TaxID=2767591 RepID=UPI00194F1887|nr:ABC-2 family transporter protein [Spirulina major]
MKWFWKRLITLLSVYYAHMVEYRAELFFWMLSGSFPIILMGVWMEASQGGQFGLNAIDFARYFIAVFMVRQFTIVWVVWEFEKEVVQGKLSFRLLQPMDPAWHHVAQHISERFARFPFVVVLLALFFLLYPQSFWVPDGKQILLGAIATVIAFSLRFLLQYTSAMLSFWTERASAIEQFFFLFYLFFAGYIAPLDVFPPLVKAIAQWTPFPYLLYFPAAIFVGFPVDISRGFMVMLGWGIILFSLNRWLWRRGLKQYSGMGA